MATAGGANAKILADIQRARDVLDGRVPLDLPAHALSPETNEIAPQDMDAYLKLLATQYHYEQILNTLKSSQQQHSDDQAAIVSYLRTELQQEEQRLEQARTHNAEMTTKCNQLQRGVDEDWDTSKQRYSDELTKLEQQQRELNIKFNKLSSLSEQKAALEESLQQHRELLEQTRAEHAAAISEFERQSVAERERLKKDMINKIRENSKRFERMTEDQLHTTTLTTIQMHQSFVDELEDQSQKTEKLLAKNKQLMAEHKALMLQLDIHESTESQLQQRAIGFQKTIRGLNDKFKNIAAAQKDASTHMATLHARRDENVNKSEVLINELEARIEEMEDVLKSADDRTAALQADLRTLRDTQDRIGALQNESVLFLLAAIEDEDKTDAVPASWNPVSDGVPLHLSDLKPVDRVRLLELLLMKMKLTQARQADRGYIAPAVHGHSESSMDVAAETGPDSTQQHQVQNMMLQHQLTSTNFAKMSLKATAQSPSASLASSSRPSSRMKNAPSPANSMRASANAVAKSAVRR